MNTRVVIAATFVLSAALLRAQTSTPQPAAANAALRYWMAFALMENPTTNREVAKRLEDVSEGRQPWDQSLGDLLQRNHEALETMRRGTRLRFTDWGLDEDLGADAPIAHVPRARALARLNVVDGVRLFHEGKHGEAVDAWLAGIRFSRDLAADGVWISTLVAGRSMEVHLRALQTALREGNLDTVTRDRIEREISALPASGLDWGYAVGHEVDGLMRMLGSLERAPDPAAAYEKYFPLSSEEQKTGREALARRLGLSVAQLGTSDRVRDVFRRSSERIGALRAEFVAAFQRPSDDATARLHELDARAAEDPVLARAWPTNRLNEARRNLERQRAAVLELLHRPAPR